MNVFSAARGRRFLLEAACLARRIRLALVGCLTLASLTARAQDAGFFGPQEPLQIQPEVDVFHRVAEDVRVILQLQGAFIPGQDYSNLYVGAFADWSLAPLGRRLLSADYAKTRALNVRLGAAYADAISPGTVGKSEVVSLQLDVTPRFFLPLDILATNRNRLVARWNLASNGAFSWRFRDRLQFEREFDFGGFGLTPFANVEFLWQSPPAMWMQFRMEGGVQCPFEVLGVRQTIELNFTAVTSLQPSRTWRPVVGTIWSFFV